MRLSFLFFLGLLGACAQSGTGVELTVHYDDSWALTRFDLNAAEKSGTTEVSTVVHVLLPDDWDGRTVPIELWGIRAGSRYAHGSTQAVIVKGTMVPADLSLFAEPCGNWCTAGDVSCQGDLVVTCEKDADTSCMKWATPTMCPAGMPFCSFGTCGQTCTDECAMGETRCDGPGAVHTCGQYDSDSCLDWSPSVACDAGEVCSNGTCAKTCTDECTAGSSQCLGTGTISCGDLNGDGCLEWGPVVDCPASTNCSAGVCKTGSCTDECTTNMCDGNAVKTCGNYDLDPCKEYSPGSSCASSDPCMVGMCSANACSATPKVCNAPPATSCADASTLRTYDSAGTCGGGTCTYTHHDTTCAGGCSAGVCTTPNVCTPGGWSVAQVATTLASGELGSIGVDAAGTVYLAWCNTSGLEVATRSASGAWSGSTTIVDTHCSFAHRTSMAIDGAGGVHIAYDDNELRYAYKPSGGSWAPTIVDTSTASNGLDPSIAVDSAGGVHVATCDQGTHTLKYGYKPSNGSWSYAVVADPNPAYGPNTSLAVDGSGGVHITYNTYSSVVRHAYRPSGGSWSFEDVAGSGGAGGSNASYSAAAVDPSGGLYVAFRGPTVGGTGPIMMAYKPSGGSYAYSTVVASSTQVGDPLSLVIDKANAIHLVYEDLTSGAAYVHQPSGGSWSTPYFVASGGQAPVVVVDASSGVHVGIGASQKVLEGYRPCN